MSENSRIKARNRQYENFTKEKEGQWKGPFIFIQSADTQFGMIDSYLEHKTNPRWDKEIALTKKAIAAANNLSPKPKFFIVCGDLIDAMPGTPLRKDQERDFWKVFQELAPDIPLVCVCGNHDLGDTPTQLSIEEYRKVFGDDYFVFWVGGVMCIAINSQYYEDRSLVQDLAEEQDRWLDEQLKEAKTGCYKHVIIFQHIPWFLKDPDEEKEYFNMVMDVRKKMLAKFKDAGIGAIFCGHYHRNAGGFDGKLEVVVTSAIGAQLGKDLSGIRIVTVQEDIIKHRYYALDDVPKKVDL